MGSELARDGRLLYTDITFKHLFLFSRAKQKTLGVKFPGIVVSSTIPLPRQDLRKAQDDDHVKLLPRVNYGTSGGLLLKLKKK